MISGLVMISWTLTVCGSSPGLTILLTTSFLSHDPPGIFVVPTVDDRAGDLLPSHRRHGAGCDLASIDGRHGLVHDIGDLREPTGLETVAGHPACSSSSPAISPTGRRSGTAISAPWRARRPATRPGSRQGLSAAAPGLVSSPSSNGPTGAAMPRPIILSAFWRTTWGWR